MKPDEQHVSMVDCADDQPEPCGEGHCFCCCLDGGHACGCDCGPTDEWRPGECDMCFGVTLQGPLGPVHCACAIGQGASEDECRCGPEED